MVFCLGENLFERTDLLSGFVRIGMDRNEYEVEATGLGTEFCNERLPVERVSSIRLRVGVWATYWLYGLSAVDEGVLFLAR